MKIFLSKSVKPIFVEILHFRHIRIEDNIMKAKVYIRLNNKLSSLVNKVEGELYEYFNGFTE
jgi:hypothetical protein